MSISNFAENAGQGSATATGTVRAHVIWGAVSLAAGAAAGPELAGGGEERPRLRDGDRVTITAR